MTVRTRIAPSPTGDPHVGTAYMGLVNMVFARQHQGQFILRVDDTDRSRYRVGSEEAIFQALHWLGLEWDEGPDKGGDRGPYRQSERTAIYREHCQRLLDEGKAYRCFCTQERLEQLRAEQRKAKARLGYDRRCRGLPSGEVEAKLAAGEDFVVRLAMPLEGDTVVEDLLRDPIVTRNEEVQDQVLLKADGYPTYHLASVVDDHLMGITHIIRAEEWITSAPIHRVLFEAFGWDMPTLCHMPLLRNDDKAKTKISKRKNPTSLLYYRDAGYLPEGFLNFLGLLGWGGPRVGDGETQEIFSLEEMLEHFRLEEIRLGGPVFDLDKLDYINGCHVRRLDLADYVARVEGFLFDEAYLRRVAELVQPRAETLGRFLPVGDFFFGDVDHVTPEDRKKKDPRERRPVQGLVPKDREPEETWFTLADVQERLERVDPWTAGELEPVCRLLASEEGTGWKARELFMSLRVALTGKQETPPLFETMEVLGKARCIGRIGEAMRVLPEPSKKALERRKKERAKKGKS